MMSNQCGRVVGHPSFKCSEKYIPAGFSQVIFTSSEIGTALVKDKQVFETTQII